MLNILTLTGTFLLLAASSLAAETAVTLHATAHREVAQDELHAQLRFEQKSPTAHEAQNIVNKKMQEALTLAKTYKDVDVSTGSYHVYEQHPRRNPRTGEPEGKVMWEAKQTLSLTSLNSADLLELAGKLQENGFAMSQLNYALSRTKAEQLKDALVGEALVILKTRAQTIADLLGKPKIHFARIGVDGAMPQPQPMPYMAKTMRVEMAAMDMAAPVAEAGESTVTMTVTAEILLNP